MSQREKTALERALPAPSWLVRAGTFSALSLVVIALSALAVFTFDMFQQIVLPVLAGAVLAIVFMPVVNWFERMRLPRGASAGLTIVLIVGIIAGAISAVGYAVVDQADTLEAAFKAAWVDLTERLPDLNIGEPDTEFSITDAAASLGSLPSGSGDGLVSSAAGAVGSAAALIIGMFLSVVFMYFILADTPKLRQWMRRQTWIENPDIVDEAMTGMSGILRTYFGGRGIVAAFDAVAIGIGALVLDIPLVSAIIVLTFIGGFIPYIGAFISGLVAVVLAFADGGLMTALIMLAIVLAVQSVLEPLVEARVLGTTMNLHPAVVMAATTAGGIAAGFIGLVLAVPLLVSIRFVWQLAHPAGGDSAPGTATADATA